MRMVFYVAGVWLLATAGACQADESFPPELEQRFAARFEASKNAFFGPPAPAARQLVSAEKRTAETHHFCVIGYELEGGGSNVWVHWQEAQRLLLWRGSSDAAEREAGLVRARRDLELGRDTVETPEEIAGSSYLVTRAWWEAMVSDCQVHGEPLTLEP